MPFEQPLSLTTHARQRLQQRGIPIQTLELLHEFGHRVYDHRGAVRLVFNHHARRKVDALLGKAAAKIRFATYAVLDAAGDQIITVGFLTRRVRESA